MKTNLTKLKLFTFLLFAASLSLDAGCRHSRRSKPPTRETVHSARVNQTYQGEPIWLYYYWIYDSLTRNYYIAQSYGPVTSFSQANWRCSSFIPKEIEESGEKFADQEVGMEDLGDAQAQLQSDYSSLPENNSLDSMEGVPDSGSSSSESGSDAGSSGGDSGGGDVGGGGGE